MKCTLFLTAIAAILAPANAIEYRGYATTTSCTGSYFYCVYGERVCCGDLPTGYGYSAEFLSLPAGTIARGYERYEPGLCVNALFTLYGPGTKCWNSGGVGTRPKRLMWFYGRIGEPSVTAQEKKCTDSAPLGFAFTNTAGKEVRLVVDPKEAEEVAALALKGDTPALEAFAKMKKL